MITELRAMKQRHLDEARSILDGATTANRDLNPSENKKYEEIMRNLTSVNERIEYVEKTETENRNTEQRLARLFGSNQGNRNGSFGDNETVDSLRSMLILNDPAPIMVRDDSPRSNYQPGVERRDLLKTNPANFTPVSFYRQIVEAMVESSAVLTAGATVITTATGEAFRVPRATAMSSAGIVAEGAVIPESDPALGVVELGAHKYGVIVQASREIVEDSGADLQAYLARMTGTALGLGLGAHLISGSGTGQPRGVLADATLGVAGPTGTTVSLGSQSTAGQGTDLLNALYASVSEPYTRSPAAAFLLRGSALATVRNLKGSTGDLVGNTYLSQSPAPFYLDPFVPAMAANAKSVLFGDWSRYFVRVVNGVRFERSDDFAFSSDLVTYRAIIRADGALIDVNAIRHFTNSAT